MFKFRIILDISDDVIREVALPKDFSLEDLHLAIISAFGLEGMEMASFYHTDNKWEQGEEIPLFNMSDQIGGLSQMKDYKLSFIFNKQNTKLLYVYDFLNLWTFFVEFISEYDEAKDKTLPLLLFSLGDMPKEAPKKEFESESDEEDEDEFDNYDEDNFYY